MKPVQIDYEGYIITTDSSLMKPEQIHRWLSTDAYWSKNISFERFRIAFEHSFSIGALAKDEQVSYARFVTDYATFAYLADVFVLPDHRGRGLSKKMMEILMSFEWVNNLRRISLVTLDAHKLYEGFGFGAPKFPERQMEITRPDIYTRIKD